MKKKETNRPKYCKSKSCPKKKLKYIIKTIESVKFIDHVYSIFCHFRYYFSGNVMEYSKLTERLMLDLSNNIVLTINLLNSSREIFVS